ncbi:MAG: 1-acyl-sn-glycerol-3-phosphate acyltransferase [Balneolaceae bacterium]|nr:1-acyl-sn-glycerol-3-phosphate acyltransferase [Balneolaceae bacterium]MCH8548995.1 1-acyl-sn-glycerol-3-phosphate acyltransferase [Balneolaceae bacterium]
MKSIRAFIRLALLILYTAVAFLIYVPIYWLIKLFGFSTGPIRNFYMRSWSRAAGIGFNMKVKVEGTPPEPPFFLVSNHLSYIDILPLYRALKCTFVAKKEVRGWPLLGFVVMMMDVIFIDRSRKRDVKRVNEIITEAMDRHQGIVLFPEGTASPGEKLLPFKASLLEIPASTNTPVHYATIHYKTSENDMPARESVCWFGGKSFGSHLWKMAKNNRVECVIRFGEEPVQESDRKELAEKLKEKMEKQFIPSSP